MTISVGVTCRVVVDLRGIPWAADAAEAERRLLDHPGVVTAEVDAVRRRAVVVHRADASLPELFNWLHRSRQHLAP